MVQLAPPAQGLTGVKLLAVVLAPVSAGEESASKLLCLSTEFTSLWVVAPMASVSCCLLARGYF